MADRFYIGQVDASGTQTNLRPYAIPDNAFAEMSNAYVFRGRVRKRFGGQLMQGTTAPIAGLEQIQSRLKINLGATDATGNKTSTNLPINLAIGQAFSITDPTRTGTGHPKDNFFTVNQLGAGVTTLSTGAATCTIDSTAIPNTVTITGNSLSSASVLYFYPATPVMGIGTYELEAINAEQVIAFDTNFAYQYSSNGWERLDTEATAGAATWAGTNAQLFWTTNYQGTTSAQTYFFVTNFFDEAVGFASAEKMRFYDGAQWDYFSPIINGGGDTLVTGRLIVQFQNRMLILNTVENISGTNYNYQSRCRYSAYGNALDADAFKQDIPGKGNILEAPVNQAIVSAQFIKNRLIVFFESSTWEIAYTGNEIKPFIWQKINTELGAESTFSQVPFDKVVLGVGNVGIHACNGSNVERIDSKIPQTVFQIHNTNEGPQRVYGIRDYYTEMVYWSFPDATRSSTYPFNNQVLTYNYQADTWAFNDDSITAFGYWQPSNGATWGTGMTPWQSGTGAWGTAVNLSEFRNVIAGNQEGYTFIVNAELAQNSQALQITDMSYVSGFNATLKVYNHNLAQNDYVKVMNCVGVTSLNDQIFKVDSVTDENTIILNTFGTTITGTYLGAGTLTRVTPPEFKTKQFNFYAEQGRNAYVSKVDFLVERTVAGQCTVDFLISSSDYPMLLQSASTNSIVGTSILDTSPYALVPFEAQQARLWHPVYFLADGEYIQFYFYFNDQQATNVSIAESDFQLHAMMITAIPTASRLQ